MKQVTKEVGFAMIATREKDDVWPVCPHCENELREVWFRKLEKDMGKRCIYFCPKCRSALGVSHRKGLTMGM